jgi:hypothetical protein
MANERLKVGDKVKHRDGRVMPVVKVDGEMVQCESWDRTEVGSHWCKAADLQKVDD